MADPIKAYLDWVVDVADDNITLGSLLVLIGAVIVAAPVVLIMWALS